MVLAALALAPAAAAETRRIALVLTPEDPSGYDSPMVRAFDAVGEGDVLLLDVSAPFEPGAARRPAGVAVEECAYGPLEGLAELSLPSGHTHLVVVARLGAEGARAAALVSCEYAAPDRTLIRLRGCFLARDIAIPTARYVDLAPLDPALCRDGAR